MLCAKCGKQINTGKAYSGLMLCEDCYAQATQVEAQKAIEAAKIAASQQLHRKKVIRLVSAIALLGIASFFAVRILMAYLVQVEIVEIVPPIYDDVLPFSEGLARVRIGHDWGFIDTHGQEVISRRYEWTHPFAEDLAAVQQSRYEWVYPPPISEDFAALLFEGFLLEGLFAEYDIHYFEDWAVVQDGWVYPPPILMPQNVWGFIDVAGNEAIAPRFQGAGSFSEGLAAVRVDHRWGFIDTAGQEVIPPSFLNVGRFSEGLAAFEVGRSGNWGFIDTSGQEVIPPRYIDVRPFSEGLAAVAVRDFGQHWGWAWGFIDNTGYEVIPPRFARAQSFSEGLAAVAIDDRETGFWRWGFIDAAGYEVIPFRYVDVRPFSEGLAAVRIGNRWGFIDATDRQVIAPRYDAVYPFSEGMAAVARTRGWGVRRVMEWGFIDTRGREVIPPRYSGAQSFSEGLAAVRVGSGRNAGWGFIMLAEDYYAKQQ